MSASDASASASDTTRLAAIMAVIAELREWNQERPLPPPYLEQAAHSWHSTLTAIPTDVLLDRSPGSVIDEMKRRGLSRGGELIAIWEAGAGRRRHLEAEQETNALQEASRAHAARQQQDGPGMQRLLEVYRSYGGQEAL